MGRPVAGELVGDEHPRHVPQSREQSRRKNFLAATAFRRDCTRTSSTLPCWSTARPRTWIVPLIFDDDFIEMPFVARPGPAPAQPVSVDLPKRAPLPDGFVADHDAALQHQLLDPTKAQRNR